MNQREKMLMIVSGAGILFLVLYYGFLESALEGVFEGGSDVAALEAQFLRNLEAMEDIYLIERDFKRVGEFPEDEADGLRAALAFTRQVSQMCSDLGFTFPPIRPDVEAIDGVEDYELINVAIRTEGTFNDTVRLLKTFESNGLIFREVDLRATRDRDLVVARVTVARIAEVPPRTTPGTLRGPRR